MSDQINQKGPEGG